MRAFVTGGTGFVGSRLIGELLRRDVSVVALARSESSATRLRERGADVVVGDLADRHAMSTGMQSCDTVFHLAGHLKMWDSYDAFYSTNVEGTRAALAAAADAGISSFVQVGASASIMGKPIPMLDIREEQYPLSFPTWAPYIATKAKAEQLVLAANSETMRTAVIRPPLIWGSGSTMIEEVTELARLGKFGYIDHGDYRFSASHVDNVCAIVMLAAEKAPGGSAYFVTDGEDYTFRDFFTALLATRGITTPVKTNYPFAMAWTIAPIVESAWTLFGRSGDPPLTRQMVRMIGKPFTLNIDRARRELTYSPVIGMADGMKQLAEHFASRTSGGHADVVVASSHT